MTDRFRLQAAQAIALAVEQAYNEQLPDIFGAFGISASELTEFIEAKIETPKDRTKGDYAFPTFQFAKILKQKPPEIASALLKHLDANLFTQTGPYVNMILSAEESAREVLPDIFGSGNTYGNQDIGTGKTIVIDFSSPNIGKPFGIGHLRSTAIGNSLYRLYKKLGYRVIGINHLGDWGTQFGKLIAAYKKWGDEAKLKLAPIDHLLELYVKFHQVEKEDPSLSDEGRNWFKRLEDGEDEAVSLWTTFKEYSLKEFSRVYDLLGVTFDAYTGESFYNDKMDAAVDRLEKAGLTKESQGALIVDLEKYKLNPCLLRRADGATLYATRDIAGVLYRYATYKFDKALYVVGAAQAEHFNQVFKVIELLGEPFAQDLIHVPFGWIRFNDQALSTREGNIILLDDVIQTAVDRVTQVIKEKNPNLPNLEATALQVAIGAIIFADLSVSKHKDVNFVWEEVLNFEGATGPYLQYTYARLSALIRKYGREIAGSVDFGLFTSYEEKALIMHLHRFSTAVEAAAEKYEPNIMAVYLLELAGVFNRFYQRKDDAGQLVKIISESNPEETKARMLLVAAVRSVLREGLYLMGIEAPEEM